MAYFTPFPGNDARQALLQLLQTPGMPSDLTGPLVQDFLSRQQAAQQARADYLSQVADAALQAAGALPEKAGMGIMDALMQAAGISPNSRMAARTADVFEAVYPEHRNPLKEVPGGYSPLVSQDVFKTGYGSMLMLNQQVKDMVRQGKSLEQIKGELLNNVMQRYMQASGGLLDAGLAGQVAAGGLPPDWPQISAEMEAIIERAYRYFTDPSSPHYVGPGGTGAYVPPEQPESGNPPSWTGLIPLVGMWAGYKLAKPLARRLFSRFRGGGGSPPPSAPAAAPEPSAPAGQGLEEVARRAYGDYQPDETGEDLVWEPYSGGLVQDFRDAVRLIEQNSTDFLRDAVYGLLHPTLPETPPPSWSSMPAWALPLLRLLPALA